MFKQDAFLLTEARELSQYISDRSGKYIKAYNKLKETVERKISGRLNRHDLISAMDIFSFYDVVTKLKLSKNINNFNLFEEYVKNNHDEFILLLISSFNEAYSEDINKRKQVLEDKNVLSCFYFYVYFYFILNDNLKFGGNIYTELLQAQYPNSEIEIPSEYFYRYVIIRIVEFIYDRYGYVSEYTIKNALGDPFREFYKHIKNNNKLEFLLDFLELRMIKSFPVFYILFFNKLLPKLIKKYEIETYDTILKQIDCIDKIHSIYVLDNENNDYVSNLFSKTTTDYSKKNACSLLSELDAIDKTLTPSESRYSIVKKYLIDELERPLDNETPLIYSVIGLISKDENYNEYHYEDDELIPFLESLKDLINKSAYSYNSVKRILNRCKSIYEYFKYCFVNEDDVDGTYDSYFEYKIVYQEDNSIENNFKEQISNCGHDPNAHEIWNICTSYTWGSDEWLLSHTMMSISNVNGDKNLVQVHGKNNVKPPQYVMPTIARFIVDYINNMNFENAHNPSSNITLSDFDSDDREMIQKSGLTQYSVPKLDDDGDPEEEIDYGDPDGAVRSFNRNADDGYSYELDGSSLIGTRTIGLPEFLKSLDLQVDLDLGSVSDGEITLTTGGDATDPEHGEVTEDAVDLAKEYVDSELDDVDLDDVLNSIFEEINESHSEKARMLSSIYMMVDRFDSRLDENVLNIDGFQQIIGTLSLRPIKSYFDDDRRNYIKIYNQTQPELPLKVSNDKQDPRQKPYSVLRYFSSNNFISTYNRHLENDKVLSKFLGKGKSKEFNYTFNEHFNFDKNIISVLESKTSDWDSLGIRLEHSRRGGGYLDINNLKLSFDVIVDYPELTDDNFKYYKKYLRAMHSISSSNKHALLEHIMDYLNGFDSTTNDVELIFVPENNIYSTKGYSISPQQAKSRAQYVKKS